MAIPESPVLPPAFVQQVSTTLAQLAEATRRQSAATIAAGIIAASGRPWSIGQAIEIVNDISFALHPNPSHGVYQEWAKAKDKKLSKVHGAS